MQKERGRLPLSDVPFLHLIHPVVARAPGEREDGERGILGIRDEGTAVGDVCGHATGGTGTNNDSVILRGSLAGRDKGHGDEKCTVLDARSISNILRNCRRISHHAAQFRESQTRNGVLASHHART